MLTRSKYYSEQFEIKHMFNKFIKQFDKYGVLEEHEKDYLHRNIQIKHYIKNEVLFKEGCIADSVFYILQGCVRLYYNIDGKEKTANFYSEGKCVNASGGHMLNVPSNENYQVLEDAFLIHINKNLNDKLEQVSPNYKQIMQINILNELIAFKKLAASFITLSAEERYIDLLKNNRQLFLRVPQQYIASYLGVSPETLSRLKRKIYTKSGLEI